MEVKTTSQFDRAIKKYAKKHYPVTKVSDCVDAIRKRDINFLRKHHDHSIGPIREIHVDRQYNDDWLLYYKLKNNQLELLLVNLGNHDEMNKIISNARLLN